MTCDICNKNKKDSTLFNPEEAFICSSCFLEHIVGNSIQEAIDRQIIADLRRVAKEEEIAL